MAPVTSLSSKPADNDVPIEELVFSCSICQATVSEVYATTESNQGFHSGSGDEDGIITKFWITECSHITCAKHLENGAAPFHPKGMPPKASCPKCLRDKGDDTPRSLYGIRGLGEGEYDAMIPSGWLRCPAIKLDSSTAEISAVRFQYMALVNYSLEIRKRWKSAEEKQSVMEAACSKERKHRRQLQSELQALQERIEGLEQREVEWKKWEERKPMINYYLGAFARMTSEMEDMRKRLLNCGEVVPETKFMFEPPRTSTQDYLSPAKTAAPAASQTRSHHAASVLLAHQQESSSSSRKRKRDENGTHQIQHANSHTQRPSGASRDLMPPPLPKPKQQRPGTNALPAGPASPAMLAPPPSQQSTQLYRDSSRMFAQVNSQWNQSPHGRGHHQLEGTVAAQMAFPYRLGRTDDNDSQSRAREFPGYTPNPVEIHSRFRGPDGGRDDVRHQSRQHYVHSQKYHPHETSNGEDNRRLLALEQSKGPHHVCSEPSPNDIGKVRSSQQYGEIIRAPLQTLSEFDTNRRISNTSRIYSATPATPVHRDASLSRTLESSPFFQPRDRGERPPPTQRPPTRGSLRPTQQPPSVQNGMAFASTISRNYSHQGSYASLRTSNNIAEKASPAPYYNPPFRRPNIATQYQPKVPVPQTPRDSQGLFHQPDRPLPSGEHPATRLQPNTSRSRISLPPNYGPSMSLASNADVALLHVPGVRGLSSQQGSTSSQRVNSAYGAPRNLFSSAGGRRSVLR